MSTGLLEAPELSTTDTGDDDGLAHYIDKKDFARAWLDGIPVQALCGKTWLPARDPQGRPVCPECQDAYELLEENND